MRSLIDLVSAASGDFLEEGRKDEYVAMFSPLFKAAAAADERRLKFYDGKDTTGLDQDLIDTIEKRKSGEITEKLNEYMLDMLAFAKVKLKRHDRIIWFLRAARLDYCRNNAQTAEFKPVRDRLAQEMRAITGGDIEDGIDDIASMFEHFLSLPIHAMQELRFGNQTEKELYREMRAIEKKWQETRQHTLLPQSDDEILLDCGDGWAWWSLPRAFCDQEGDAMGHCGNEPRKDSNDTILSLRKQVKVEGHTLWKPYATFILTENGELTEMKGRFNKKPGTDEKPEVHALIQKHIVALLKHKIVRKVVGGGWAAEHNFSLYDLDDETRGDLMKERPEIGFAADYGEHKGFDEVFAEKLQEEINQVMHAPPIEIEGNKAIVASFGDALEALREIGTPGGEEGTRLDNLMGFANDDFPYLHALDGEMAVFLDEDPRISRFLKEHDLDAEEIISRYGDKLDKVVVQAKKKIKTLADNYLWNWLQLNPYDVPIVWTKSDGLIEATVDAMFIAHGVHDLAKCDATMGEDMSEECAAMMMVRSNHSWFVDSGDEGVAYDSYAAKQKGLKRPSVVFEETRKAVRDVFMQVVQRLVLPKDRNQLKFDF